MPDNRTMVTPAEILQARKAKLLAEAAAIDDDAREFEKLVTLADKYGFALVPKDQMPVPVRAAPAQVEAFEMIGPAYRAAISVAEQTIKAAGVPLELSLLYNACVERRVKLNGKRPQSTLSAYLSDEKSTVESIRKGVYWLKGVPVPR